MVEKLLQLLVGEVDTELLEAVELLDRDVQTNGRGSMRMEGLSEEQRKENRRQEQPSLVLCVDGERSMTS